MQIYLVGGAVRDLLLKRQIQDKDYVVIEASEKEFLNRFPTAKKIGKKDYVYVYNGSEYTISDSPDIFHDLQKRDITINALAQDDNGQIIAISGALDDLKKKILRPVRYENFFQDPLRVIRAARIFACLPEFTVHNTLKEIMTKIGKTNLLQNIAPERVGQEVKKACSCPCPGNFLCLMTQTKNLDPWLKEFSSAQDKEIILKRTAKVMDKAAGSPILAWMGLLHELGTIIDNHFLESHCRKKQTSVLAQVATQISLRLRMPKKYTSAALVSVKWYKYAANYDRLFPETKVDLLLELHAKNLLQELFQLVKLAQNKDFIWQAQNDLQRILSVKLPLNFRNLGSQSGKILRQLRSRKINTHCT